MKLLALHPFRTQCAIYIEKPTYTDVLIWASQQPYSKCTAKGPSHVLALEHCGNIEHGTKNLVMSFAQSVWLGLVHIQLQAHLVKSTSVSCVFARWPWHGITLLGIYFEKAPSFWHMDLSLGRWPAVEQHWQRDREKQGGDTQMSAQLQNCWA